MQARRSDLPTILCCSFIVLLLLSGYAPFDRATWVMEVTPVFVALPMLWLTSNRFPLTTLLYACIFLHAVVLILGGAYSYARVPLGFWIQSVFTLDRNPYDKIGHFFQGFVPALLAMPWTCPVATVSAPSRAEAIHRPTCVSADATP